MLTEFLHLSLLFLPSRSWMMCAWQNTKVSEQMLTHVTLGMDVKILYRTLWCQQPLMTGCLCNCCKVVGILLVVRHGLSLPKIKD